jgi:hypothetical protein
MCHIKAVDPLATLGTLTADVVNVEHAAFHFDFDLNLDIYLFYPFLIMKLFFTKLKYVYLPFLIILFKYGIPSRRRPCRPGSTGRPAWLGRSRPQQYDQCCPRSFEFFKIIIAKKYQKNKPII